jgi:sialidase-1
VGITAAISTDEGRTWRHIRDLETRMDRTYSYASLTFVDTRAVLSYWERDAHAGRISNRFRSLPVQWFYGE